MKKGKRDRRNEGKREESKNLWKTKLEGKVRRAVTGRKERWRRGRANKRKDWRE